MRHASWRVAELMLLPTLALGAAVAVAPSHATLATHLWIVVVLALGLLALLAAVRAAYPRTPSSFDASLHRTRRPVERPALLVRLEREVSMASSSAFDVHARLRPTLVELAAELLPARRGVDLAREPERARELLGDETWELVRPDRPVPEDRSAPGIDLERLERVVASLEAI
jgi:hypothetical protein